MLHAWSIDQGLVLGSETLQEQWPLRRESSRCSRTPVLSDPGPTREEKKVYFMRPAVAKPMIKRGRNNEEARANG